jgi:hypothetical protein
MLEGRVLLAGDTGAAIAPWHNQFNPKDVNGDNRVTPRDALIVINDLMVNGPRAVPSSAITPLVGTGSPSNTSYLDVNGDNRVTPSDALRVVNALLANQLLEVEAVVTDLSGTPITSIAQGEDFKVSLYVQDLNDPPTAPFGGVFSAYFDLMYDTPEVTVDSQLAVAGPRFSTSLQPIDVSTPGQIPGFVTFGISPPANPAATELLWSIVVHADMAAGDAQFLPSFDAVADHDVLLFGNDQYVLQAADIRFIGDSITILGPSSLSVSDVSVFEGNAGTTPAVFEVSVASDPTQPVTVSYTTLNVTATLANNDYVAASGTLAFLPGGSLTQLVTVLVNGDTTPESDETFSLSLVSAVNGDILDGTGIGTILNDDNVPTLAVTGVTQAEGNAGNTPFVFTASLSAASAQPIVIVYNTTDGTATTANNDYVAASGTLTFTPGQTSKLITVSVLGDNSPEPDETFLLTVTPTAGTLENPDPISVLGTILNDEGLQAIIRLQLADLGGNPLPVGATLPQNGEFLLQAYVRDIREVPQGVYQAFVDTLYDENLVMVNGPIDHGSTFVVQPQGSTATLGLLDEVGGIDDGAPPPAGQRGDEFLLFSVPFQAIGTGIASFTLDQADLANNDFLVYLEDPLDDPIIPPAEINFVNTSIAIGANVFSIDSVTTPEGNSGTTAQVFTVTRFLPTNDDATVVFNTADGAATTANNDYAGQSGTLTFTAGQTTQTITINVTGDTASENSESYSVVLSNATGAGLSVATGVGTINNDDDVPTLSINNVNGNEGQPFSFVVSLSAPSGLAVTVPFSTLAVSATAGQDYTATSGTLTFAPGVVQQTVVVQTLGDAALEPSETFQVVLGTPVNATILSGTGTGTIADVPPQVLLVLEGTSGNEGDAGITNFVFVASLSGATTVPVVVTFATANGTATVVNNDYIATSGTLTFAPGETSKNITVGVVGGLLVEPNETFSLNLTRVSGPTTNATTSAIGTIKNDDGTPTLNITDVTVVPGASGMTNAVFIVSLSPSATEDVTVGYSTVDVTAEAGIDYLPQSGNLTFTPGGSLTQFITVPVLGSPTPSADETFEINLSGQSENAVIGDSRGVGTIIRQGFTTSSINIIEGNAGTSFAVFTVNLSQVPPQTVTVVYNTTNDTATAGEDYVAQSGTLTFLAGETTKTISITINGDTTVEPNESFFLNLTGSTGAAVLTPQATATIVNDDGKRATVRLQLADVNGVPLPVGDSLDIGEDFTLQVFVQDIQSPAKGIFQAYIDAFYDANLIEAVGPIVYGSDFDFGQFGSLVTPGVIDEAGGMDDLNPPDPPVGEQLLYSVRLRATDLGQAIFTANAADTNELDVLVYTVDEPVPEDAINFIGTNINIGQNVFTVSPAEVEEGDSGQTNMVFTVNRFLPDPNVATVVVTTSGGTATPNTDYVSRTETLTFAVGETSKTVTIAVKGDTTDEPNETFQLVLSNAVNATSSQSPGIGTIVDDDGPVGVSIADAIGNEGDDISFLVTLSATSGQTVVVSFNTAAALSGNLATAGVDYEATSGTLTFLPGVTQQTVTVEAKGDIAVESSEVFRVLLSAPTNAVIGDGQAQGTILDVPPALISGFVFVDLDKDGNRDGNETGIANVIITATRDGDGFTQSTLTNADGSYELIGLIPGTYTLTETQPGFYTDGRDKHLDFETPTNDKYTGIVLGPSQAATDYNFGENGVRPDFVMSFINRRAFFASAIVTGQWGSQIATGGTVNPKTGDVWVSFDGGWDGQRIIDAVFDSAQGTATMSLYNNSLVKVADSFPTATGAQIIYNGVSGAPYFLKISGTNSSVALTIHDPTVVPLAATSGSTGGSAGDNTLQTGRFASAADSEPSATPATSPSANDLVWQEDDDWVADSLLS